MAATLPLSFDPPRKYTLQRCIPIVLLMVLLGACGVVDYDMNAKNFFAAPKKEKDVGTLTFHYADGVEPYQIHVRRINSGYAMQAPIFEDVDGRIRLVANRTHSDNYFMGVEGRFSF